MALSACVLFFSSFLPSQESLNRMDQFFWVLDDLLVPVPVFDATAATVVVVVVVVGYILSLPQLFINGFNHLIAAWASQNKFLR